MDHIIADREADDLLWKAAKVRALAAQTCKSSHYCERYCHVMNLYQEVNVGAGCQCMVCDLHDQRQARVMRGEMPPFFIICYDISRYCYSQAEGGCWADWTDILEVRKAYTFRQALKYARELKDKYPTQHHNRFSVLGNGEDTFMQICYSKDDPRWPEQSTQRAQYC